MRKTLKKPTLGGARNNKFEADATRACCLSCVTALVRALRVSDAHECTYVM